MEWFDEDGGDGGHGDDDEVGWVFNPEDFRLLEEEVADGSATYGRDSGKDENAEDVHAALSCGEGAGDGEECDADQVKGV